MLWHLDPVDVDASEAGQGEEVDPVQNVVISCLEVVLGFSPILMKTRSGRKI